MRLLLLTLLTVSLLAAPEPTQSYPDTPANRFAEAYNAWGRYRVEDDKTNAVSVQQIRAWASVKKRWKELERSVVY